MEGEGSPSDEQTEDPTGQSASGGYFGLEVDGGAVDAAIAVDRSEDGGIALVGGQGGVLDIEELGADLQRTVGSFAAVYPDGCAVGDLLRGGQAVVGDGESYLGHDIPQGRVVGGVEDDLIAGDCGTRGAGYHIDRLLAVEEGKLVAFKERCVVVDDRLRELSHSRSRADGERAEGNTADKNVAAVLRHTDAGERAACNLIGSEDGSAVNPHHLGDVHLDYTEVGLNEGVVDIHSYRQVFEPTTEHRIELLVYSSEIGPLSADIHLSLSAERGCGLHRQFADDGSEFGLAVEELAYLAADFGVDTENFCHNVFPFCFNVELLLAVFLACSICAPMA